MAGHGTDSKSQATPTKAPKSPKVAKRGKRAKVSKPPKRAKTAPIVEVDADCAGWKPSPKQVRLLAAFEDRGYDCKIADVCKAACISRRTYYLWHENEDFSAWWVDRVNRFFRQSLHRVHVATLGAATTKGKTFGSVADRKLFYERFDKDFKPADAAASAPAPVTVRVDVVEAMREMIEGVAARALAAGGDCFSAPLGLPCDRVPASVPGDVVDVEPVTAEEDEE